MHSALLSRRTLTRTLLFVATACAPLALPAVDRSGSLVGTVIDFDDRGIRKVNVTLTAPDDPDFKAEATTDKQGRFEIDVDDAVQGFEITLHRRGYAPLQSAITLRIGSPTERTFIMLTPADIAEGRDEIVLQRQEAAIDPAAQLFNEGVAAMSDGYLDVARSRFESALVHDPNLLPALSTLSLIAVEQERWADATELAARTLDFDPEDPIALYAAYRANHTLGNLEAASDVARSLTATGANVDAAARIFNDGAAAYRARELDRAAALFEEASGLDPTLAAPHAALAAIQLTEGRFGAAAQSATAALELEPGNEIATKVRFEASLAGNLDSLEDAAAAYWEADPDAVATLLDSAATNLFEGDRQDEASRLTELLLELDPSDPRGNYVMGLILVNEGDHTGALPYLRRFVELAPDDDAADSARTMITAFE
jgi:tetratricopeptide (TPR) repeat protein